MAAGTPTKKRSKGSGSLHRKQPQQQQNGGGGAGSNCSSNRPSPPPPVAHTGTGSPLPSTAGESTATADDHQRDYRVALFGAGGVGKSSIVQRFIKNTFSDAYVPTIEDTYQQVITCGEQGRLAVCTLHITDTTGSHQFPAMQRLAMQRGNAFILVYSVTSRQSLEELGPIVRTLREVKGDNGMAEVPVMLVGNKSDDEGSSRREVGPETGDALANRWGCGFVETSAKQNQNVTEIFQRLLALEKRRHLTLSAPDTEGTEKGGGTAGGQRHHRKCAII